MAEDTQEVPQIALEAVIGFNGKINCEAYHVCLIV